MRPIELRRRAGVEDVREDIGVDDDAVRAEADYVAPLSPNIASKKASTSSGSSTSEGSGNV